MRGKFYRKELSKEFNNGLNYKSGVLQGICITISRQFLELFSKIFAGATEVGR